MSDLREAFEALARIGNYASVPFELMTQFADDVDTIKAALQSQTAGAVPEGWELRKVEAEETTISVHRKSDGRWCAGGQLGAYGRHGLLFEFFDAMLTAAPQPDHSPDAGKVVQGEPVAVFRCIYDETGCIKDHWLDWKAGAGELKDFISLYTHPAESREEIQAEALEAFEEKLLKAAHPLLKHWAVRLCQSEAARLRGDKGVE